MNEQPLKQRKHQIALKTCARNLEIHSPDTDKFLLEMLRKGVYNQHLITRTPDNFWFNIPQPEGKPLVANIKRVDVCKFELYILYDKHLEIKKRTFGKGGTNKPHPLSVTTALDDLFSLAFATYRNRPADDKIDDLPLFKIIEQEAVPA